MHSNFEVKHMNSKVEQMNLLVFEYFVVEHLISYIILIIP